MSCLVDTNILVRLANTIDAKHAIASHAIIEMHRRNEQLVVAAQNLIEFRKVATRPLAQNGLGLSAQDAAIIAAGFEAKFQLIQETPAIYPAWKVLVDSFGIIGKQVHDARLVAVCHLAGVTHVLTFNAQHFARMAAHQPGVIIVDPVSI